MIYFVEDDASIRELVLYTLKNTGMEARGFSCGSDFWRALELELPQMILLDLMLPDEDGLAILRKIRSNGRTERLPVILITAKGSEYDKVIGFESGADDYIPKPFGMMELVVRIKSLLRRTATESSAHVHEVAGLKLDSKRRLVLSNGSEVNLTLKEFELLRFLMKNTGIVLTREQLISTIWGYDFDGESRTLDVHIRTLRSKLGDSGTLIQTIRGVGYKIGVVT